MIDLPPMLPSPAFEGASPEARIELAKSRKSRRGRAATAAAIGTIVILSDGSKCQIAGYDRNGDPLCYPVED